MGYFQNLWEGLSALDTSQEDDNLIPIDPEHELVIGIAEDNEIKQLHCLLNQTLKNGDELLKNLQKRRARGDSPPHEEIQALAKQAQQIIREINLHKEMLQFLLRRQFPVEKGYSGIALRQGWRVVCIKDEPKDKANFIAIMFGPGI